jgi:sugar lactone lactonase YvrE
MTVGGDRSALTGKWLIRYDVASQQSTTLVSQSEQIPGVVDWSPNGQWVAYAAVEAGQVNPDLAYRAAWDNPAVAGRRVYLMNPGNGVHTLLNAGDAFQDAPLWSDDAATLYYVQRQDQYLLLMAFDMSSAQAQPVPGAYEVLPETAGSFGQLDVEPLLSRRPAPGAARAPAGGG